LFSSSPANGLFRWRHQIDPIAIHNVFPPFVCPAPKELEKIFADFLSDSNFPFEAEIEAEHFSFSFSVSVKKRRKTENLLHLGAVPHGRHDKPTHLERTGRTLANFERRCARRGAAGQAGQATT